MQGDLLSPFLLLIAAKGLSCLMRKAVELKQFEGLEIGCKKIVISHLQFANDTVLLGKMLVGNANCLRWILRLFELASGLKVNFHKSSVHGVHTKKSARRCLGRDVELQGW